MARKIARARGFTMVEMVVAIAIVAVLAAIAAPIFLSQKPEANLKEAIADIAAIVRSARSAAVSGRTVGGDAAPDSVEVRFEVALNEIHVVANGTGAVGARGGFLKVLQLGDYHPGQLSMVPSRPIITFRRNGAADAPATVQLNEALTGRNRVVEITRAGLVRVQ
jgi:prepilin-type N-terminal cleavage/methylation domain-containing protein